MGRRQEPNGRYVMFDAPDMFPYSRNHDYELVHVTVMMHPPSQHLFLVQLAFRYFVVSVSLKGQTSSSNRLFVSGKQAAICCITL